MVKRTDVPPTVQQEMSNKNNLENNLEEKILEILGLIRSLSVAQNKLRSIGWIFQANFLAANEELIREYFKYWRDT